jgi:hypothetical protein
VLKSGTVAAAALYKKCPLLTSSNGSGIDKTTTSLSFDGGAANVYDIEGLGLGTHYFGYISQSLLAMFLFFSTQHIPISINVV